jgi:uncharacterized protein (DUF2336 family)
MSMIGPLLRDLDRAAATDEARRERMLGQIADLYLGPGSDFSAEAVGLFDEVFVRLATEIERRARIELAERLAESRRGPPRLVRQLVHDEVEVARPLIERGAMVSEDDLLSVAMTRGDAHREIVAGRPNITEKVTSALVERGGQPVLRRVVANATARISRDGFERLVARAGFDEALQTLLAERKDLPIFQIHKLIDIAGDAAKTRLRALLGDVDAKAVSAAVDDPTGRAHDLAGAATARRSNAAAQALVEPLLRAGALGDAAIRGYAEAERFEEIVCALASLTRVSLKTVEAVFDGADADRFLVICRAIDLPWTTVRLVVKTGFVGHPAVRPSERMRESYEKLSAKTAQRIVQFLAERERSGGAKSRPPEA